MENLKTSIFEPLNKVTTTSKVLAGIVFVSLPFIGFMMGMMYAEKDARLYQLDTAVPQLVPTINDTTHTTIENQLPV